jgi:hypothetical protein
MGSCDRQRVGIAVPRLGVHARKHGHQRNEREQIDAVVLDKSWSSSTHSPSIFTPWRASAENSATSLVGRESSRALAPMMCACITFATSSARTTSPRSSASSISTLSACSLASRARSAVRSKRQNQTGGPRRPPASSRSRQGATRPMCRPLAGSPFGPSPRQFAG